MKRIVLSAFIVVAALASPLSSFADASLTCNDMAGEWVATSQGGYQSINVSIPADLHAFDIQFVKKPTNKDGGSIDFKKCSAKNGVPTAVFYKKPTEFLPASRIEAKLIGKSILTFRGYLAKKMYVFPTISLSRVS